MIVAVPWSPDVGAEIKILYGYQYITNEMNPIESSYNCGTYWYEEL